MIVCGCDSITLRYAGHGTHKTIAKCKYIFNIYLLHSFIYLYLYLLCLSFLFVFVFVIKI